MKKIIVSLLFIAISILPALAQEGEFVLDQKNPVSVVDLLFYSYATKQYALITPICYQGPDPKNSAASTVLEGRYRCNPNTIASYEQAKAKDMEIIDYTADMLSIAKTTGEVTYTNYGDIEFAIVNATVTKVKKNKTKVKKARVTLLKRDGNWYLYAL